MDPPSNTQSGAAMTRPQGTAEALAAGTSQAPSPASATTAGAPSGSSSSFGGFWGWASAREDIGQLASRSLLIVIAGVILFAVFSALAMLIGSVFDGFLTTFGGREATSRNFLAIATPILLRASEIFLTLVAALLVFLLIVARANDAILSLLGVVIIAAIVLPAGDIVRLGTVFGIGDSDRDAQAFRASSEGEAITYDRSGAFAQRVIARAFNSRAIDTYFEEIRSTDPDVSRGGREELMRHLLVVLAEDSYVSQLERLETAVRQRGIARLLIELLDTDRARQMALMPATIRSQRAELLALRDLGLISASQADFQNLAITSLGLEVACRIAPDHRMVLARIEADGRNGISRNRPFPHSPDCRVDPGDRIARDATRATPIAVRPPASRSVPLDFASIMRGDRVERVVQLPRNGSVVFVVEVPPGPDLPVRVRTRDSRGVDPVIELLRADGSVEDSDDDSGGQLNALLEVALPAGRRHEFRLRDFAGSPGQTTVEFRRLPPRPADAPGQD